MVRRSKLMKLKKLSAIGVALSSLVIATRTKPTVWVKLKDVYMKYARRIKLNDGQHKLTSTCTGRSGIKEFTMVKWSEQGCREVAMKMIVMDEFPFSFIEKDDFRYFCKKVIVKEFLKMYEAENKKLKRGHCLCLTTDTWTSVQNINYMVVTAHFIDLSWKMQKRILNFKVIPNHNGNSIGVLLEDCLLEWGMKRVLTSSVRLTMLVPTRFQ